MPENKVKKLNIEVVKCDTHSPFTARQNFIGQKDFDKYYINRKIKEIFKKTGVDSVGDEVGVVEYKTIDEKIDIDEYLKSQADTVGVDSYIRALSIQGVDINDLSTVVDEKIDDFSQCPETLADTLAIGDAAKTAFDNLDPVLKGNHTSVEGFLNSLSKETLEAYLKNKAGINEPAKEGE